MWIKFDGGICKLVCSEWSIEQYKKYKKGELINVPEAVIPENEWMHVIEMPGMLFIDGKEIGGRGKEVGK